MKNRITSITCVFLALFIITAACASTATPEPTAVPPTDTALPTATSTPIPPTSTATPRPTATPNLEATKEAEDTLSRVQSYVDAGYLASTDGQLFKLDDYKREFAQIDFLDFDLSGWDNPVQNFAVWANVKWENAAPVQSPQYSGCGFSFRIDPKNYDGYTAMLTNDRVLLTYCDSSIHRCGEVGKTRGSGRLKLGNPAEAMMELVVNDTQAYVKVDGKFLGEYTLFKNKLVDPGYLIYSIISGTNHDYGIRCEITNSRLWIVK